MLPYIGTRHLAQTLPACHCVNGDLQSKQPNVVRTKLMIFLPQILFALSVFEFRTVHVRDREDREGLPGRQWSTHPRTEFLVSCVNAVRKMRRKTRGLCCHREDATWPWTISDCWWVLKTWSQTSDVALGPFLERTFKRFCILREIAHPLRPDSRIWTNESKRNANGRFSVSHSSFFEVLKWVLDTRIVMSRLVTTFQLIFLSPRAK